MSMPNNTPKEKRYREFLRTLRRDVDKLLRRPTWLSVYDGTPDTSLVNAWVSWNDGKLYWRSPDGTVQSVGTAGHGGTGSIEGQAITTELLELTPDEIKVTNYGTGNHMRWGDGSYAAMRFTMPALTPTNAEILKVELTLQALDQIHPDLTLYVAGDSVSNPIGTYTGSPAAVSKADMVTQEVRTFTISRVFGENLRDGVWNAIVFVPDPGNAKVWGLLAGLNDNGVSPVLRIYYEKVV